MTLFSTPILRYWRSTGLYQSRVSFLQLLQGQGFFFDQVCGLSSRISNPCRSAESSELLSCTAFHHASLSIDPVPQRRV